MTRESPDIYQKYTFGFSQKKEARGKDLKRYRHPRKRQHYKYNT